MNLRTKTLSLAVIAAAALMGCSKEVPPPPPVQAAPAHAPAAVTPVAAVPAASVAAAAPAAAAVPAASPAPAPAANTAATPATMAATPALAGKDLAAKSGCLACHAVDKKLIGPAYKDVAKKYKGDAAAAAKLADKVIKGGQGVWGPVPMPPNKVTDDEAKKMVVYILAM